MDLSKLFFGIEFKDPWYLLLALLLLPMGWLYFKRGKTSRIGFSSVEPLNKLALISWRVRSRHIIFVLQALVILCLVMAFARPRKGLPETEIEREGIDIVLVIDRSSSMLTPDFEQRGRRMNRLQVVKDVVGDFIGKRENDRIGIVTFARYAFTQAPLSSDRDWLKENVAAIEAARPRTEEDGTAIGDAIGTAINRLKYSRAKSKIIVALTDGENNVVTWLNPLNAAKIAQEQKIKVYTIGAGAATVSFGRVAPTFDEQTLKQVAQITDGQYFRATDTERLQEIYGIIDKLERAKIESKIFERYKELAAFPISLGGILFILELILSHTLYRTIP